MTAAKLLDILREVHRLAIPWQSPPSGNMRAIFEIVDAVLAENAEAVTVGAAATAKKSG